MLPGFGPVSVCCLRPCISVIIAHNAQRVASRQIAAVLESNDTALSRVLVLLMAIFLVFAVLLMEFRSFYEPVAIIFGAVLAMFGTVLGLWITGTSLNVVSFLGAIIGVGAIQRLSAVRWGIAQRIVWAWILTIPGAFAVAWLVYLPFKAIG